MAARFSSGGRVYDMATIDEITPRDLITFPRDASEVMGRPIRFADVERISEEVDAMTEAEAEEHPDLEFLTTVLIWISRRAAGDKLSYGECLDEPFSFVEDKGPAVPKDRQPSKKKARSRPSSGAAKAGGAAGRK